MPTKYKPQLDHVGFDWIKQSNQLHQDLIAKEPEILKKLGFYELYGDSSSDFLATEAREVIRELSGIISQAAAIRMDAGFKAPNKLVSTLEAVKKDPSLILTRALEPEALAMLALHYQRGDEPAGSFWWDIYQQGHGPLPDPQRVRIAASNAILALETEAGPGRPPDKVKEFIALRAREMFLQYNVSITRHSVASSSGGKDTQVEGGRFLEFLELLLAPLNRLFSSLSKDYHATPVSSASVARMAVEFKPHQLQQRRPKGDRNDRLDSKPSTQLNP